VQENKRLPGTTARDVWSHRAARGFFDPINAPINLSRVETSPGAACLTTYLAFLAPKRISRDLQARAKAAPLQALGDRASPERAALFEDDDEDDYDRFPGLRQFGVIASRRAQNALGRGARGES
jgi:hypothetical protein